MGRAPWQARVMPALLLALLARSPLAAAEWSVIEVPGAWEKNGPPAARAYDGAAWYRTWVRVHADFFRAHERNLFQESVALSLDNLSDAYEVFVNGRRVGGAGRFPPDYQSGRDASHRHKVPSGSFQPEVWNEIAVRVYNPSGPGGFLGEAPFLMNYMVECVLEGAWEFLPAGDYTPGGPRADRPATSAFDHFRDSSRVLAPTTTTVTGPRLSAAESQARMKSADDLQVELLLAEPVVAQPTHVSFDERGRMWVSQYRQYPYPAGLRQLSRDKFYRAQFDRSPPPPPHHDRGADRITIHEDSDGDGTYDRHTVFLDGLNMANAAVRGDGGVWVMSTPYLLFYPDADSDDRPDGPPVIHLQGFGLEDTHSVANGLAWGPDGWLYGGKGNTSTSRVTRPGIDPPDASGVYVAAPMVWRYHPKTRAYEIFAEGSGNLFGLEFDAEGRLFSGHNSGGTRGWHYVQGGIYDMQALVEPAKYGPSRNLYAFGFLPAMKSPTRIRRFAHFFAVVEGSALPARYRGHLFSLDPLHNEVIDSERLPSGSTFFTRDVGRPVWSEDEAFRPVFIVNSPQGALVAADFYDYYIAHGQHYQSQIDASTGRIYRVRGKDVPLETDTNLAAKSPRELVALLAHRNKWHRQSAVRLLATRMSPEVVGQLRSLAGETDGSAALGALWVLHQSGALDDGTTAKAMQHGNSLVRLWAARFLGDTFGTHRGPGLPGSGFESRKLPAELISGLINRSQVEPDAEVRAQLAATARRLPTAVAVPMMAGLLHHDADAVDPFLPLLIWWTVETHLGLDRAQVIQLFDAPDRWERTLAREHILPRVMRRFAVTGLRQDLLLCAQLLRTAPTPDHARGLVRGFEDAYRGRAMSSLPEELHQALSRAGELPLALRVQRGESAAIERALTVLSDGRAPADERAGWARMFGDVKLAAAIPALRGVASTNDPPVLRKAALSALGSFDDPAIGPWAVGLLSATSGDVRAAAFSLLAGRAAWSLDLLHAVEARSVAAPSVPGDVIDRIRRQGGENAALAGRLFPVDASANARPAAQRDRDIEATVRTRAGNPYAGEAIFQERCAGCHRLFHKGGRIGPDLTDYQRDNLPAVLRAILLPSAEIREGYEFQLIETTDGRRLAGFVADRDGRVIVVRTLDGEDITLPTETVRRLEPVGRSLMPEGLLDGLNDEQLANFFAFLRSSQPISK